MGWNFDTLTPTNHRIPNLSIIQQEALNLRSRTLGAIVEREQLSPESEQRRTKSNDTRWNHN